MLLLLMTKEGCPDIDGASEGFGKHNSVVDALCFAIRTFLIFGVSLFLRLVLAIGGRSCAIASQFLGYFGLLTVSSGCSAVLKCSRIFLRNAIDFAFSIIFSMSMSFKNSSSLGDVSCL